MRKMVLLIFSLAFAVTASATNLAAEKTITLKDDGQIVIQKTGTMIHTDAKGNRVRMTNDKIMDANDAPDFGDAALKTWHKWHSQTPVPSSFAPRCLR